MKLCKISLFILQIHHFLVLRNTRTKNIQSFVGEDLHSLPDNDILTRPKEIIMA